jgi:trehalose 6-phosphate synthase
MNDRDTTAGYDLVVAANWLPVRDSASGWRDTAGSAARPLRAAVAARGGAWIGCGIDADQEALLADDLWLHPLAVPGQLATNSYQGHCLSTLLPLYVDGGERPRFGPHWREAYRRVNYRMATAAATIAAPEAVVWIHDYHLQLMPGYLRHLRPDLRIGFFLHTPFPSVERFTQQPMREQVLAGLLGADLVGFQQERSLINFLDVTAELGPFRHDDRAVHVGERKVAVGVFPSSVDVAYIDRLASDVAVQLRAEAVRSTLGSPRLVLLSAGAPYAAEGVRQRLDAYADLLAEGRLDPGSTAMVHIAACGDEDLAGQPAERDLVERQVAQINGLYGRLGQPVVHYVRRPLDPTDLIALYVAADVMLATPLRQGMTLAAKEYVAARTDDTGRLVLSEFTGAAADLPEADIVNPHDAEALKTAILTAAANAHVASAQMHRMRQRLRRHDSAAWATSYLTALTTTTRPDLTAETFLEPG